MSLPYTSDVAYSSPGYSYDGTAVRYIFTTPTVQDEPPYLPDSTQIQINLWRHYTPGVRGVNVFLLSDGTYVQDTATDENQNTSIPYPIDFNNPGAPFVSITNFDGTTEFFYQNPYVVKQYFGGTQNVITPEEADLLSAAGYGAYVVPG